MTQTLARVLRRTKTKKEPEYLPPYFWHRFSVWIGLVYSLLFFALTELIERAYPNLHEAWFLPLGFVICNSLYAVPNRLRRRWAEQQKQRLWVKLFAQGVSRERDQETRPETLLQLLWLYDDLDNYVGVKLFKRTSLSVRLSPWQGDGTRFTVYERKRPKRVYTFFHD